MGNSCLRREKSMVWAGDDWESIAPPKNHRQESDNIERERLLGEECTSKTTGSREVKIKITKKQLEELVGRSSSEMKAGRVSSSSVEQVLAQLLMSNISDGDEYEMRRDQHSWRPALQSIPEVN